jgi:mannitol-specific phosphotransferase system IIBC component
MFNEHLNLSEDVFDFEYDSDLEDIINSCKSGYLVSNISTECITKKAKPPSALELENHNQYLKKIKKEKEKIKKQKEKEEYLKLKKQKEKKELEEFYKTPAYVKLISDYLEFHRKNKS